MAAKVVGVAGRAGHGKGATADYLVRRHGFVRVKFATYLKAMLRAMLREMGVPHETIERMLEGDLKEVPTPLLGGKTPRWAMQSLGNEWGRDLIASNLWVDAWKYKVELLAAEGRKVVVDDCRYENEAQAIRSFGGVIVFVERPGVTVTSNSHVSERFEFQSDLTILNDGTISQLHERINLALELSEPHEPELATAAAALA